MSRTPLQQFFTAWPRWSLRDESLGHSTLANIQTDSELLRLQRDPTQTPLVRIWENPRSLIVTRRETRLPHFQSASDQLAADGWPVVVRDSGGTAVPHEPGVIHLSLIYHQPPQQRYDIDLSYQALCEPIRLALAQLGIDASYGTVPGAYCDGRYNLVVAGRKITGTAQRLIPVQGGGQAVLSQAMVNVVTDVERGTAVVNRFYQLAGDPRHYDPSASTSLNLELPLLAAEPLMTQFRTQLRQAIAQLTQTVSST